MALSVAVASFAKPQIVKPTVKTPTSFAIFIDRTSYDKCRNEVEEYKAAVEADGLATYIYCDEWQSPEQVRDEIIKLATAKVMPLEGVVFVGEIPIAMLRDAQHLSSAFKMNQASDWKKSSIPSDRYYDDFDLKFNFIKQDAERPLYFYYSMDKNSAQYVNSDIYSARVRPIVREGVDKYDELAGFFRKAAAEHRNIEALDRMFVFCGHGYNSESYDAWSGEQVALAEQLPSLQRSGSRIVFSTFDVRFPMKRYVLQYVQNPDIDVALCHHHGSPEQQYMNGYQNVSSASASIENVKRYLRSKTVDVEDSEKRIADYMKSFDVPRDWFDLSDSTKIADSIYNWELDINLPDLYAAKPEARFVMFDACYNGSFHLDEYIAGAYIFGKGRTVTTMGNSVNSLQDKWPDRYIGLLGYGVRIGEWARHTLYLESHIIGDPTLHFANAESVQGINEALTLRAKDNDYWLAQLNKSQYADVRSVALRKLSENRYKGINKLLYDTYLSAQHGVVRMECLRLLSTKYCDEFIALLPSAMNDNYELVRRMAAQYIGKCGHDSLIAAEVNSLINDNLSMRVSYHTGDAMTLFDAEKMKSELSKQYAAAPNTAFGQRNLQMYIDRVERTAGGLNDDMKYILDKNNSYKRRLSEVTTYRNYNYHCMVPQIIALVDNKDMEDGIRIAAVEALGWFKMSYQRPAIIDACKRFAADTTAPTALRDEAEKTLNRLAAY